MGSREYEHAAEVSINITDCYLDLWRRDGNDVVVTADHGMDELGNHLGIHGFQRRSPYLFFSDQIQPGELWGPYGFLPVKCGSADMQVGFLYFPSFFCLFYLFSFFISLLLTDLFVIILLYYNHPIR